LSLLGRVTEGSDRPRRRLGDLAYGEQTNKILADLDELLDEKGEVEDGSAVGTSPPGSVSSPLPADPQSSATKSPTAG
jgi:hypothetical protein